MNRKEQVKNMSKVFIGVGHGGSDPGAVGYIVEKDINLKMAKYLAAYLQSCGVDVLMSRTTDENDPLTEEIRECNTFRPDLAVDVHNNAGGGDGFECYYHLKGGTSKTLAENIEAEVIAIGQNSRGCKTRTGAGGKDYYGFIRETSCPAVICEGVFVDNEADAAQADTDEKCRRFGEAYARGILKTLGIIIPAASQTETSNQPAGQLSGRLYYVQIGAFADKANAEALAHELIDKGYQAIVK